MTTAVPPMRDTDFSIAKEDWSRYQLADGTLIKVRIVVRKIRRTLETNPMGYPDFSLDTMNAVTAIVPDRLLGKPSEVPWDPKKEAGEEIRFEPMEEQWQEYWTPDGFRVMVKPVVTKIFRYGKHNMYGEPIYNVIIQHIVNIEKLPKPSPSEPPLSK